MHTKNIELKKIKNRPFAAVDCVQTYRYMEEENKDNEGGRAHAWDGIGPCSRAR